MLFATVLRCCVGWAHFNGPFPLCWAVRRNSTQPASRFPPPPHPLLHRAFLFPSLGNSDRMFFDRSIAGERATHGTCRQRAGRRSNKEGNALTCCNLAANKERGREREKSNGRDKGMKRRKWTLRACQITLCLRVYFRLLLRPKWCFDVLPPRRCRVFDGLLFGAALKCAHGVCRPQTQCASEDEGGS